MTESVIYYTLHKTASSYFSNVALKNIQGLTHIDYTNNLYFDGAEIDINIKEYGCVYGPLRLSNNEILKDHVQEYEKVLKPFLAKSEVYSINSVFQIRDPRDILVSNYFHQAKGYKLSSDPDTRSVQKQTIENAQKMSIDEFILQSDILDFYVKAFDTLTDVYDKAENKILLKYEDMIENWEKYINNLLTFVSFDQSFIDKFYIDTRPAKVEDKAKHKRSGKIGDYKRKLQQNTINQLNTKFETALNRYEYQI